MTSSLQAVTVIRLDADRLSRGSDGFVEASYSVVGFISGVVGVAVVSYLGIGALAAVRGLLDAVMSPKRVLERSDLPATVAASYADAKGKQRSQKWGLGREITAGFFSALPKLVTWPVESWHYGRNPLAPDRFAKLIRRPFALRQSAWLLICAVFVAILVAVVGHHWYLRLASYSIVIALLSIQAAALVAGENLRENLRRTVPCRVCRSVELRTKVPWALVQFAVIAATSFITLTVVAVVLLRWPAHTPFRWSALWLEARDIWGTGRITALLRTEDTSATNILVAVCGAAVIVSLVSQVWNPRRFLRNADDRIDIARKLVLVGCMDEARDWLTDIPAGSSRPLEARKVDGMFAIKQGDLREALERATNAAAAGRFTGSPKDQGDAYWITAQWALNFWDTAVYASVIEHFLSAGIADGCLAAITDQMLVQRAEDVAEVLTAIVSPPPFEPPEAGHMRSGAERREPPYPLTVAVLAIRRRDLNAASELLGSVPADLPGSVVKTMLAGDAMLTRVDEERRRAPSRDLTPEVINVIDSMLAEARSWHIDQLPSWLREYVAGNVEARAYYLRNVLDEAHTVALRELDRDLVETPRELVAW